ncbi:hypothetical protein DFJ58DRAFT_820494 [Suillus subalutaceus]|uniref:uncharacterized protein n=1 Tax=Suillus subalutaceus TaxID=48586 RepID=UPI001B868B14|nr:uncharacterized protein DFJ58DRAFT_820494 [Suillus subalutaceus]KAG1835807.1 hypothetical protein DFJ58DRAFT_820494 [Suillus subalutaceus]
MVDWNDPDLEAKLGMLSVQLLYAILGLYGWEYIRSSHVEIALLRRQLPFRWPLLSYITARFSFLIAIILHAVQSSPFYTGVDCQSECFFCTNVAIGCSTTNLMIRTWLIWKTNYLLCLLLILLSLGHWTVLTLLVIYGTHVAFMINGYVIMNTSSVVMLYDLALLVFTVIGLLRMPSSSTLWKTLVKQGVVYFIINFLANLILLVLNRLNLNLIMNVIFGTPGMCPCTIASNQVVLSLLRPSSNYESDSTSSAKVHPLTTDFAVAAPW